MSDLIEREDAIKDFADYLREADLLKCDGILYPMEHYLKKAERHMKRIPSARTKGEWFQLKDYMVMGDGYMWHCSNCGHGVYQDSSADYPTENFCPKCGADMRPKGDINV